MNKPTVNVAIALLFHHSKVLVGWREAKQHQGNKYEFPGGKVEQNESPVEACRREILEEVGIDLRQWHYFDLIEHEYDDICVRLHLFHSHASDEQMASIQQPWAWYAREKLKELNFPKANDVIIERLIWPNFIKISADLNEIQNLKSEQCFYLRVEPHPKIAQQIEKLKPDEMKALILNIELWNQLSEDFKHRVGAVHLKHHQILSLKENNLPKGIRCIGACHDQDSLTRAQSLGCDALILSPVLATTSHPELNGMGWESFNTMAHQCHLPVFALGGLKPNDLELAQQHGAYGIAGLSQF